MYCSWNVKEYDLFNIRYKKVIKTNFFVFWLNGVFNDNNVVWIFINTLPYIKEVPSLLLFLNYNGSYIFWDNVRFY